MVRRSSSHGRGGGGGGGRGGNESVSAARDLADGLMDSLRSRLQPLLELVQLSASEWAVWIATAWRAWSWVPVVIAPTKVNAGCQSFSFR